jgi:hypothetical protein
MVQFKNLDEGVPPYTPGGTSAPSVSHVLHVFFLFALGLILMDFLFCYRPSISCRGLYPCSMMTSLRSIRRQVRQPLESDRR